ncbi:MAG: phenylalanine--tRNA ligase subunit alpha, partial [Clostridiales bacterium]|nr:phenylalanine--tRNA ligase subunit alpha [Clostridiales bacterium]
MKDQLIAIRNAAEAEIQSATDKAGLESARVKYLGKKGELTAILRGMGALSSEERPVVGQIANEVREAIEQAISQASSHLEESALLKKIQEETIDVTLPGIKPEVGKKHPLTKVLNEIEDIFLGMGFSIASGPEVEYDYYNFEALNIPKNHPSRDTQDTFYISENVVLRTQTSPMQIRTMKNTKPPIRIIAPGRV